MQFTASRSSKALVAITRAHALLWPEVDTLRAVTERQEGLMRLFAERVCTGYVGLMCTHTASYGNRLSALLSDAQSRGEYVGGYHICISEDCYSLPFDEATSDEERGDHPSTPKSGDGDIIEVVLPPLIPPPGASYYFSPFFVSIFLFATFFVNVYHSPPFCFGHIINKVVQCFLNYISWRGGFFGRGSILISGVIFSTLDTVLVICDDGSCWGGHAWAKWPVTFVLYDILCQCFGQVVILFASLPAFTKLN